MSTVELLVKTCTACNETKPASEWYRNRARKDGLAAECKACARSRVDASKARRRQELGEAEYLRRQREIVARSRKKRGMKREREYRRAQRAAHQELANRHRKEYEHLLLLARRGELEANDS